MVGLVLTKTGSAITIEFNDYSTQAGTTKASFDKSYIGLIYFSKENDYINISIKDWKDASLNVDGSGGKMKVDSVDSVTPVNLSELFDALVTLRS